MNMMTQFNHNQNTMSNIELLEVINQARKEFNEKPVRLNDFNNRIADELEGEYYETFVVRNPNGTTSQGFNLNIDQCTLIGMRESKSVRKNVLAVLKQRQFDITNPAHLLQAIEVQARLNIELSEKVAVLEPKADALDQIADTKSTFCIRDAAKAVGVPEKKFIQFLMAQNWIYRSKDGCNTICAYSKRLAQKVMAEKVTRVIETSKGPQVFTQARITSKGLTRLAAMVKQAGLVEEVAA
ncbi:MULTISPECIES: phage antirepressor KilAC domain-containing protein [unclassified Acinetobacter]|uniref:phage antirepressor KilAC domain-containing protein n=1 Tax=unclassified Acinetobacter TaxID=196816 RepID=UPI0015D192B4|nr:MULTISPECIES: phage antirepressor KilAC domain-containing protein [unclassified Acinetobacter]